MYSFQFYNNVLVSTDLVEVCSVALRMNQLISYHLSSKSKPL